MIDSPTLSQSLAGLLEAGSADEFDWDTSALADWPNIVPAPILRDSLAAISSAASLPAGCDRAC